LPFLLLIVDVATAAIGWRMAVSDNVSRGSRAMYQGDSCQNTTF
jgi:hypothetical protein